jgi:uncharacterized iron-regulated protein
MKNMYLGALFLRFFSIFFPEFSPGLLADPVDPTNNKFPYVYESKTWQRVGYGKIAARLEQAEVLIIGEVHNDTAGHQEMIRLLRYLRERYALVLSMEMIEKDQSIVFNEYMLDALDEKGIYSSLRLPENFKKEYEPIISEAKKLQIEIRAANVPRRYARMVARKGLSALAKLPQESLALLPPIYSIIPGNDELEKRYAQSLGQVLAGHQMDNLIMENWIHAQQLWDASMAHNVATYVYQNPGRKIIQLNGRFHSDHYLGVTHRLKKMGIKVVTISMFPVSKIEDIRQEYRELADFVIISEVNPNLFKKTHGHGKHRPKNKAGEPVKKP